MGETVEEVLCEVLVVREAQSVALGQCEVERDTVEHSVGEVEMVEQAVAVAQGLRVKEDVGDREGEADCEGQWDEEVDSVVLGHCEVERDTVEHSVGEVETVEQAVAVAQGL